MIWTGILGFLLGFLCAFCWQQYRLRKAAKEWGRQRKKLKQELSKATACARTAAEKAAALQRQHPPRQKAQSAPLSSVQLPESKPLPKQEKLPDFRKGFRAEESLTLVFQYALPESLLLQSGKGFLRNAQNELIPDEDAFTTMNSSAGYAMEGTFYLYHALYHGKEYTFRQILNGEMGHGYVRLQSVLEPAKVKKASASGYYSLSSTGKLLVVDAQ